MTSGTLGGPRDWQPPQPELYVPRVEQRVAPPRVRTAATPLSQAYSVALAIVSGALLVLVANLVVVSQVQSFFTQHHLYSQLRLTLAEGATPLSAVDQHNHLVAAGTPVAVMNAASVGLSHAVVVQGTDAAQTMQGIGHLRDTVMPCQAGSSVLMARSGSYGAIGAKWAKLTPGEEFSVTMGQGSCTYRVVDQRLAGQKAPAPPSGDEGHLTLTTALGRPFAPSGVLRIDTTLVTASYPASASAFPASSLPPSENAMASDTSGLFPLILLLELVAALAVGVVWAWKRWGRWQAWLVATPAALALALVTADNVNLLLPNLL